MVKLEKSLQELQQEFEYDFKILILIKLAIENISLQGVMGALYEKNKKKLKGHEYR